MPSIIAYSCEIFLLDVSALYETAVLLSKEENKTSADKVSTPELRRYGNDIVVFI